MFEVLSLICTLKAGCEEKRGFSMNGWMDGWMGQTLVILILDQLGLLGQMK